MNKANIAVAVSALYLIAQVFLGVQTDEVTQAETTQAIGTVISGVTILVAIGEKFIEKYKARKK